MQLPSVQCTPVNASNDTINLKHHHLGPELKFTSYLHWPVNTTFAGRRIYCTGPL